MNLLVKFADFSLILIIPTLCLQLFPPSPVDFRYLCSFVATISYNSFKFVFLLFLRASARLHTLTQDPMWQHKYRDWMVIYSYWHFQTLHNAPNAASAVLGYCDFIVLGQSTSFSFLKANLFFLQFFQFFVFQTQSWSVPNFCAKYYMVFVPWT